MLTLAKVNAGYDRIGVLREVDLSVPTGDLRVIIGPNGAGKSTLMRVAFGLVRPTGGTVSLDGIEITAALPRERLNRGMAFVPQHPSIFPHLTVEDNLEMGLFQFGAAGRAPLEKAFACFELIARRRKVRARNLSGGERRLLEIARALMVNPRILLLDEPSLGLSPSMMATILQEIYRVNAEGVTVVLVEQRIKAALEIAKSVSVLRLGQIVYSGSPDAARDPDQLGNLLFGRRDTGRASA